MSLPNQSNWQQIQRIFEQALEIPEEARLEFVRRSTDEQEVFNEVTELLAAYDGGAEELEHPRHFDSVERMLDVQTGVKKVEAIEGYEIQDEIHRGGQGVVYRALQVGTKRVVALKFMHAGPFAGDAVKKRFEREVELASSLRHPGIVRIFDSGLASGEYFYAMEYIQGDHLDDYVTKQQLSIGEILRLFVPICEGLNYAHQRGVIHRDLKPSNILVDSDGQSHIVDFGLAKIGEAANAETQQVSYTGQVMGTLQYMSPEQASGRLDAIDTRSDVYSLAVILYRLLTDRMPYALEGSLSKNLSTIQDCSPLPMKGIGNEVATIVFKALSKDPDRRYQTAGDFGKDIRRFLNGETIEAKRDSALYVFRKTVQRHRLATSVTVAFAALIIASTVVGWGLYLDAEQARYQESIASLNYQHERDTARMLRDESQRRRYFVEMDLAGRLLNESGGIARIEEIVNRWHDRTDLPEELRGWEWYYLNSRIDRHLYELGLEEVPNCARFSPDASWIAFGDESGIVRVCPVNEMSKTTVVGQHEYPVRAVSWSSDGKFLASGSVDQHVFVYDASSWNRIWTFPHDDHVVSVQWHPKIPLLASSSNDGVVKIWDAKSGKLAHEFDIGAGAESLDWSPDGKQLVVGSWALQAKIWSLQEKKLSGDVPGFSGVLSSVRWNRAGRLIAVGEDNGDVSVRNVAKQSEIWKLSTRRHIRDLKWSPDSQSIAVVGKDRSIKIWSPFFPVLLREIDGHRDEIWSIDWSADGESLLTASADRTLKVWRARDLEDDRVLKMPGAPPVTSLAWHPDDSRIAVGTNRAEALVFDSQTGKLTQKLDAGYQARLQSVAWSPDGRQLASGGWDEKVVVWDTETVEKVTEFNHDSEKPDDYIPNIVNSVSWNQDGTKIASSCYDSSIFVWNPENGDLIKRYAEDRGNIYSVDWNPVQPDLLAASTSIHGAWIWSLDQQQPKTIQTAGNQARCIRWNPDGTRFAVCRDDGLVTIHDTETMNLQVSLKNHLGQVFCVDWHPEGKRLATASEDGTVRIWDAVTGTQTISFERLAGPVTSVGWSHNGQSLAAGGDRGIVQVFDATIGYQRAAGQSAP